MFGTFQLLKYISQNYIEILVMIVITVIRIIVITVIRMIVIAVIRRIRVRA